MIQLVSLTRSFRSPSFAYWIFRKRLCSKIKTAEIDLIWSSNSKTRYLVPRIIPSVAAFRFWNRLPLASRYCLICPSWCVCAADWLSASSFTLDALCVSICHCWKKNASDLRASPARNLLVSDQNLVSYWTLITQGSSSIHFGTWLNSIGFIFDIYTLISADCFLRCCIRSKGPFIRGFEEFEVVVDDSWPSWGSEGSTLDDERVSLRMERDSTESLCCWRTWDLLTICWRS